MSEEDLEYIDECRTVYNTICGKFPPNFGKALSRRERDTKDLATHNFVYSEISFDAIAISIMKIIKKYGKKSEHGALPSHGAVFCDLGSGIGKTLVAASLLFNFTACRGIELLESLHRGAEWVMESYQTQAAEISKIRGKLPAMELYEGDFLNMDIYDWRKADLLFINAACYGEDILTEIMKLSMKMKKGAFVVSVSYAINHKEFEMCEYCELELNFGMANVFIQQKTTDPHEYVEPIEVEEEEEDLDNGPNVEDEVVVPSDMDEEEVEIASKALSGMFG